MTHICVSKLTIIGSDNGLSPGRRQAIIWTNALILLIGPIGTNFSEILIEILTFSFKKMRLKVSSVKRRSWSFCLGHNKLKQTMWSYLVFSRRSFCSRNPMLACLILARKACSVNLLSQSEHPVTSTRATSYVRAKSTRHQGEIPLSVIAQKSVAVFAS